MLNSAVLGLGNIGIGFDVDAPETQVASHTKAYLNHPDFSLVAGFDPSEAARSRFEAYSQCPSWDSIDAYQGSAIDILSICTPTSVREDAIRESIDALKPRMLILEKPVAASVAEAERVQQLCVSQNVLVTVNYFRRFLKSFQELKERIAAGDLGKLQNIGVCYSNGLFNNASHFLNLIDFLFCPTGFEVKWRSPAKPSRKAGDVDLSFVLEYQDLGYADFRVFDESAFSLGELDLVFEQGRIQLQNYGYIYSEHAAIDDPVFKGFKCLTSMNESHSFITDDYMMSVIDCSKDVLTGQATNPSDLNSAISTLKVCEAIMEMDA